MAGVDYYWDPKTKTQQQRDLFEEWRLFTIQELLSCKKGVQPHKLPAMLDEMVGERIPLNKMGFRHINQFLYTMAGDIDVRSFEGKYYVFVKESAVPESMDHIRDLVLGQRADKSSRHPSKHKGTYVPARELVNNTYNFRQPNPIATVDREIVRIPRDPRGSSTRYARPPVTTTNRNYQPGANRGRGFNRPSSGRGRTYGTSSSSGMVNRQPLQNANFNSSDSYEPQPRTSTGAQNRWIQHVAAELDNWDDNPVPTEPKKSCSNPDRFTRNPTRKIFLPGLDEEDEGDWDEDMGDFDYYSGNLNPNPVPTREQQTSASITRSVSSSVPVSFTSSNNQENSKVVKPPVTLTKEAAQKPAEFPSTSNNVVKTTNTANHKGLVIPKVESVPSGNHKETVDVPDSKVTGIKKLSTSVDSWENKIAIGYTLDDGVDVLAMRQLLNPVEKIKAPEQKVIIEFPAYFVEGKSLSFKKWLMETGKWNEFKSLI